MTQETTGSAHITPAKTKVIGHSTLLQLAEVVFQSSAKAAAH